MMRRIRFGKVNSARDGDAADGLPITWGRSFVEEDRELLRGRCRLVFGMGLLVSAAFIFASRGLVSRPEVAANLLQRWEGALDLAHFTSFVVGLLVVEIGRPDLRRMQWTAFAVVAFNALLLAFSNEAVAGDLQPELVLALILFVPAAVIPWRVGFQAALGVLVVIWPLLAILPGTRLGAGAGASEVGGSLPLTLVGLGVLAVTSVLVSRTLYRLQKKNREVRRLGNYLVERRLGEGAMGEIYAARHARLVRPSAVKVLRTDGELNLSCLRRFEQEVQLAASLSHPNTITIFDYGRSDDGSLFYAMEYLEGLDLRQLVSRFGPMPPERVVHVLTQVCGSLSEAHSVGIVHRDLKPANVFLTRRGGIHDFVKVLDFGIARRICMEEDPRITRTGAIVGTPEFIAPESAAGSLTVDGRADIYSLGATAVFLLTGEPPFTGPSVLHVIRRHLYEAPAPPSTKAAVPIPAELDALVLRCLEKVPERRWQSAGELAAALQAVPLCEPWSADRARAWWTANGSLDRESAA